MKKRFGILLVLITLVNCSKPMDDRCVQGNCLSDLQPLVSDKSVSYTLKTGGKLLDQQDHIASNADTLIIDEEYDIINNFPMVEFDADPFVMKHLSGLQFRGRPNFTYEIVMETTKDHLIFYKVGFKKDIPSQEWSYARTLRDGRLEVPLLAYNINLVRMEYVEDTRGELTQQRQEFPAYDLGEATHYTVDLTNRKEFERPNKKDIFPKDILDGEWYFTSVVVFNPSNYPTGIVNNRDFNFSPASKVVFRSEKDSFVGYNINTDEDVDISEWQNLTEVLDIPAAWVDFKVQPIGKEDVMREALFSGNNDLIDISAEWDERSFVRLNFAKTRTVLTSGMDLSSDNIKLYELELAPGYISFVVEYESEKLRIRHSLLRVHDRKITSRIYHLDDMVDGFGLFFNVQNFISDYRYYRRKDITDQLLLNRFYPEPNEKGERIINYYFTKISAPLFDDTAEAAINYWDQAHVQAETGIRLKLIPRTQKEVSLGDLRYNAINTLDLDVGSAGLLGYGPSVIDTQTGEIISATSNTYVSPFRISLFSMVESYIRAHMGSFDRRYLDTVSDTFLFDSTSSSLNGKTLFGFHHHDGDDSIEPKEEHDDANVFSNPSELIKKAVIASSGSLKLRCNFHYGAVYKDFIKTVEENCVGPGSVKEYLANNASSGVLNTREQEKQAILKCVDNIIKPVVQFTQIHEMGHNMNLAHNFAASSDAENYPISKEDGTVLGETSSSMDYTNLESRISMTDPFPYDVAAIRYGYKGQIEVREKGEESYRKETVSNGQSIRGFLDHNGNLRRRPYRFCSDMSVSLNTHDPLCRPYDRGSTPLEVVQFLIDRLNSIYAIHGHRLDRHYGPISSSVNRYMTRLLGEMRVFYDQWRYYLSKYIYEMKGNMEPYLHTYNLESYSQLINDIQLHPVYSKHFRDYYPAAMAVFNFYKSLLETPTRHCMVWHREKGENSSSKKLVKFFEFYHLREQFVSDQNIIISDCNEPNVEEYLKSRYPLPSEHEKEGFETVVMSVGKHLRDFRKTGDLEDEAYNAWTIPGGGYFFNEREDCERIVRGSGVSCIKEQVRVDVVGLSLLRRTALDLIISRNSHPQLLIHKRDSFMPNMLDDPFHASEMLYYLKERLFLGLNPNAFFGKLMPSSMGEETSFIPVYDVEAQSDFFIELFQKIRTGLWIPQEIDASFDRSDDFYVLKSNGYADIQSETTNSEYEVANVVDPRWNSNQYVAVPKNNPNRTSLQLISYYKVFKRNMDFFRMFTKDEWQTFDNPKEETASLSHEEFCTKMSEMEQMSFDEIKRGLSCLSLPSIREMEQMTFTSFHENRLLVEEKIDELKSSTAVKIYKGLIVERDTDFLRYYNSVKKESVNMDEFLSEYGEVNLLALLYEFHSIPEEQRRVMPSTFVFAVIAGLLSESDVGGLFVQEIETAYNDVIEKNYLENEHEYIPQLDMLTRILLAL